MLSQGARLPLLAAVLLTTVLAQDVERHTFHVGSNGDPDNPNTDIIRAGAVSQYTIDNPMIIDTYHFEIFFHAYLDLKDCNHPGDECHDDQHVDIVVGTLNNTIGVGTDLAQRIVYDKGVSLTTIRAHIRCVAADPIGALGFVDFSLPEPAFKSARMWFKKTCAPPLMNQKVNIATDNLQQHWGMHGNVATMGIIRPEWDMFHLSRANPHLQMHDADRFYLWVEKTRPNDPPPPMQVWVPYVEWDRQVLDDVHVNTSGTPMRVRDNAAPNSVAWLQLDYICHDTSVKDTIVSVTIGGLCYTNCQPVSDQYAPITILFKLTCGPHRTEAELSSSPGLNNDVVAAGKPQPLWDPSNPQTGMRKLIPYHMNRLDFYGHLEMQCQDPQRPECSRSQEYHLSRDHHRWSDERALVSVKIVSQADRSFKLEPKRRHLFSVHIDCQSYQRKHYVSLEIIAEAVNPSFKGFSLLFHKECAYLDSKPRTGLHLSYTDDYHDDGGLIVNDGAVLREWQSRTLREAPHDFRFDPFVFFHMWLNKAAGFSDAQRFLYRVDFDRTVIKNVRGELSAGDVIRAREEGEGATNSLKLTPECFGLDGNPPFAHWGSSVVTATLYNMTDRAGGGAHDVWNPMTFHWLHTCDNPSPTVRRGFNLGGHPRTSEIVTRGMVERPYSPDSSDPTRIESHQAVVFFYGWMDMTQCGEPGSPGCFPGQRFDVDAHVLETEGRYLKLLHPTTFYVNETDAAAFSIRFNCTESHPFESLHVEVTLKPMEPEEPFDAIRFRFQKTCLVSTPRPGFSVSTAREGLPDIVQHGVAAPKWAHHNPQDRFVDVWRDRDEHELYIWLEDAECRDEPSALLRAVEERSAQCPNAQVFAVHAVSDEETLLVDCEVDQGAIPLAVVGQPPIVVTCKYACVRPQSVGHVFMSLSHLQYHGRPETFDDIHFAWEKYCLHGPPVTTWSLGAGARPNPRSMTAIGTFFLALFLVSFFGCLFGTMFKRFMLGYRGIEAVPFIDMLRSVKGRGNSSYTQSLNSKGAAGADATPTGYGGYQDI